MFPPAAEIPDHTRHDDAVLRALDAEIGSGGPRIHPELPPGPALAREVEAAVTAALDLPPDRFDDSRILDALTALERVRSWLAALEHRMIARYADRHPGEAGRPACSPTSSPSRSPCPASRPRR